MHTPPATVVARARTADHAGTKNRRRALRIGYWDWRKALNAFTVVGLRGLGWWWRALGRPLVPRTTRDAVPRYRKLFVMGCPRSGTTWLASMLQQHPCVIATTESHAYSTVLGPFVQDRARGDAGWRRVLTRYDLMAHRPWGVGLHRYVDRRTLCRFIAAARAHPTWSDETAALEVIRWSLDHFFAARDGTSTNVLVEKTPAHQFYADCLLRQFPEARVVEVIRDARDVCVSMEMLAQSQDWAPGSRRVQLETWLDYVRHGIALRGNPEFANRIRAVRFEELKADPAASIAGVFAFMGVDCPTDLATRIAATTDFSRYPRTGPGRPKRKGAVGDWRQHFTAADAALVRELAADILLQLGYRDA